MRKTREDIDLLKLKEIQEEAIGRHQDVHIAVAAYLFDVDETEVTPELRNEAKIWNFVRLYGSGHRATRTLSDIHARNIEPDFSSVELRIAVHMKQRQDAMREVAKKICALTATADNLEYAITEALINDIPEIPVHNGASMTGRMQCKVPNESGVAKTARNETPLYKAERVMLRMFEEQLSAYHGCNPDDVRNEVRKILIEEYPNG